MRVSTSASSASSLSACSSRSRISSFNPFISASASGDGLALDGGQLVAAAALLLEPRDRLAPAPIHLDEPVESRVPRIAPGTRRAVAAAFSRKKSRGSIGSRKLYRAPDGASHGAPLNRPLPLPDVDVVIVNRDGGDSLFAAIRSLEAQEGIGVSVVLVDNDSSAAERERLTPATRGRCASFPFSRNLGFAGAANEGIARTRSPFVLLVNNDATVAPDYVARLAARLALDERLAAVQGLVRTADGRPDDGRHRLDRPRRGGSRALGDSDPSAAPARSVRGRRGLRHGGAVPPGRARVGGAAGPGLRRHLLRRTTRTRTSRCGWLAPAGASHATRRRVGAARGLAHRQPHAVAARRLDGAESLAHALPQLRAASHSRFASAGSSARISRTRGGSAGRARAAPARVAGPAGARRCAIGGAGSPRRVAADRPGIARGIRVAAAFRLAIPSTRSRSSSCRGTTRTDLSDAVVVASARRARRSRPEAPPCR